MPSAGFLRWERELTDSARTCWQVMHLLVGARVQRIQAAPADKGLYLELRTAVHQRHCMPCQVPRACAAASAGQTAGTKPLLLVPMSSLECVGLLRRRLGYLGFYTDGDVIRRVNIRLKVADTLRHSLSDAEDISKTQVWLFPN